MKRSPTLQPLSREPRVQRTLADHQRLRTLFDGLQQNDVEALDRFGKCLTARVRFEERALFSVIESLL